MPIYTDMDLKWLEMPIDMILDLVSGDKACGTIKDLGDLQV